MTTALHDAASLAARIPDGTRLALPADQIGLSMAVTRELLRRRVRDLDLVCVPIGGLQVDLLIGAGCVRSVETSAVSLGEYGGAPRFNAAVKTGSIGLRDATCPAIFAALQAGAKNIPFIPLRGMLGTDVLARRGDWKVIDNPFASGAADPIVLLPAIRPDVALFHAPLADRHGNVFIGRDRELLTMAHAAQRTLVSVEAVTEGNLLDDEARAGAVIPAIYVDAVALAPRGAWPLGLPGHDPADPAELARYAAMAASQDGFDAWVAQWLAQPLPVAA